MRSVDSLDEAKLRRKPGQGEADAGPRTAKSPSEAGLELSPLAQRVAEQLRHANRSPNIFIGQLAMLEWTSLLALSFGAYDLVPSASTQGFLAYAVFAGAGLLSFLFAGHFADSYQINMLRHSRRSLKRAFASLILCFAIMLVTIVVWNSPAAAYQWLGIWFVFGGMFLLIERYTVSRAIRRWTRNGIIERRAVIVGGGDPAKTLIRTLEAQEDGDIRICGIFDDRQDRRSPNMVAGYPKLGTVAELVTFARETRIDMLIIALPLSAEARILELVKKLWILPVDIRLAAHSNSLRFRPRAYSHVGDMAMLDLVDKPIRDWDAVAKRIFDLVFTLIALFLLWPVMLVTAIAVKATSKGPVLFVQKRHGFNNEIINVLKFRSMYTEMSDPTARLAVTKNDPRVTPVGRFIRKTSIDELPQLFNVLKGDLSLVGPRPHAVLAQTHNRLYKDIVESYFARHRVKPGVTGWAQVNGWRGEIDHDDKIRNRTACDLYYIENWSLLLDLKILFMTPFSLFNMENAY
ncbi:undecaprenyl-phosphate glucose phosphotransferase [Allorhizobium sp. BGMRC 0089]|uniref:undecaprenyl-phosphate glucose phosphotransferase n=1 Tax=Allorhizobium sonneratiae TaxID=2934936 RepID=UPI0020338BAA|nr:undecaprenyl-phosphate glucose phosphotransferase [Allorhizobium sonneratiae]MCM2292139.1 undecaprenyl-phosphate glucose phosphotransferase [Allorhizobium sonneratiae]